MVLKKIFRFYYEGFKNLSDEARKSWIIILIKLFFMFAILKYFFFPDILETRFDNDEQRIEYIENQLLNTPDKN